MKRDTIFRITSMTKPVTAAAAMICVEECALRLDDPVDALLPELAARRVLTQVDAPLSYTVPAVRPITVRDLLTFTFGLGQVITPETLPITDALAQLSPGPPAPALAPAPDEWMRRFGALPLMYQPGERWLYNTGADVLGVLIARASGQRFETFLADRIFAPLGMTDTGFHVPADKLPRLASLYHRYGVPSLTVLDLPSFVRDPRKVPPVPSGGGGLYSSLGDYARFAQMLLNRGELDGTRILSAEAVTLMTANHLPKAITDAGVVAGFQRMAPGRGYGFNGAVFYDPAAAGAPVGRGTYQWDGASGVWFWVDPENQLMFVGLIQRMMQEGMPRLQELTQAMVAEAIAAGG